MITQSWAVLLLSLCIFDSLQSKALADIQPATDGTGTIVTPQGDQFKINGGTQTGDTLFHSFDRFNLTAAETAIFLSDPGIRNILSRVTGGDASIINGLIQIAGGNANLYLMNPAGVLFGSSARLNVPAAFGVTTANGIGFGNGRWFWATGTNDYSKLGGSPIEFAFLTPQSGGIFNAGRLIVQSGQSLTLVGGTILNTGTLSAPGGDITIAAIPGEARVRVSQAGSLLSVELPLAPEGEAPHVLPKSLPQLLAGGMLNDAVGVVSENGMIKLTSSPAIGLHPGTAIISGQVLAHSTAAQTSKITLLGDKIALIDATLNASGASGGTIRIGGDYQGQGTLLRSQFVFGNDKTQISADGLNRGGTIVLWADNTTRFYGTLTAGGLVETSGKQGLDITGARVNANTWLLDPSDINIVAGGTGALAGGIFDPITNTTIDPNTLAAAIDSGTSVTLTTNLGTGGNGDITLTDSINQTGGGTASLSLIGRRFLQNGNATINLNSTGSLSFNLNQVNPEATPPTSSIQSAIAAIGTVSGSRIINLSAGTYTGNATIDVNRSVLIQGAGSLNTFINGGGTVRVIQVAPGAIAGISDLTITGGNATAGSGGGILNAGNLTINNSTITNNTAEINGGGIHNLGTLGIENSNISENRAGNAGGGIQNDGVDRALVIANSRIQNNSADRGGGLNSTANNSVIITATNIARNTANTRGGGIQNDSTMTIANSTILNNRANFDGGAIYNSRDLTITNSTLAQNSAEGGANSGGGAIQNASRNANLTVNNSRLVNNRSETGGAIDSTIARSITINSSLIDGNIATGEAGGILSDRPTMLTINDTQITNNRAGLSAGGIFASGVTTIRNSTIANNTTQENGGGIYNVGDLTIRNANISNNTSAIHGGGLDTSEGNVTVNDSTFTNNIAKIDGGAIRILGTGITLTVTNSQFLDNTAGFGGAIEASLNSLTTLTGTTIDRNTATVNGGGIQNDDQSTLILSNSSLSNNRADLDGGGLFGRGSFTIVNSTLSNNAAARYGGGIARSNPSGTVRLLNSTIASNQAGLEGGGIYAEPNSTAIALRNTLIATNTNANSPDVRGTFDDQGNNLIGITNGSTSFTRSTLVGTAANPIDPKLAPLTQRGTVQIRALQVGSPAIDAGNNFDAPTTDQQGSTRIVGGTIDIGAVESNFAPVSPDRVINPEINPTDLTIAPSLTLPSLAQSSQADQGVVNLEQSLNQDFEQYFGLPNTPPITTAEIQNTLTQVQQQKGIRTGIIYAMFVPRSTPPAPPTGEPKEVGSIFPLLRPQKRNDDRLDLILITATGQAIHYSTSADRTQVTQQAKLFRLAVSDAEDPKGYVALSQQLYGWLLQPLEPELKKAGIISLIYCLDEGLRTVPIAALSDETGSVINRYAVSVIPSMTLIDRRLTQLTGQPLLAMGADRFQSLEPLPAVSTELNLVSQQFWSGKRFLNQDFTLATLITQKQQFNPGILHLATHAQFNAGAPDRSYIQLWDTQIRFNQLRSLQLNNPPIDLLVLSACDTAVGNPDAELGFAGLAAALGVRSTLGSLWDVSDIGTLALMSEFYIELKTAPTRVEALRRAQLSLLTAKVKIENGSLITTQGKFPLPINLTSARTIAFTHPFYWSAFTLVGNPW